jgi:hypothetical protein
MMQFTGSESVKAEIFVDGNTTEQVGTFKYLGFKYINTIDMLGET